jgi:hypothetical protein
MKAKKINVWALPKIKGTKCGRFDLSGKKFGRLTAIKPGPSIILPSGGRPSRWECQCDCGQAALIKTMDLLRGTTKSCGCFRRENSSIQNRTHGKRDTPTYAVWRSMHARCKNSKRDDFKNYGARGIAVAERWDKFENFLEDMGEQPKGLTLERRNNNGNYHKGNCRWATRSEQLRNFRGNRLITFDGRTMCVTAWAEVLSVPWHLLFLRLRHGWSVERTLTTPHKPRKKPTKKNAP